MDEFNEHCWKDAIPEAALELYAGWRRETFVGARPSLLAIDLYDCSIVADRNELNAVAAHPFGLGGRRCGLTRTSP